MTTRVAFLRAVNLGRRTTPMKRVAELFTDELGFDGVRTYVNSGNVVFDATGRRADLEARIERVLEADFGFEVTTFVRTAAELRRCLAVQPFTTKAGDTYFVTFLKDAPSKADAKALEALGNDFDTLAVHGRDVHWLMHGKSTDTRIPAKAWARIVGDKRSTSRNTTMLAKLLDKLAT